jgi:hypothetical protein
MRSPEYVCFLEALLDAPPGYVQETAEALLGSKPVIHPLFREFAELCVQIETDICGEQLGWRDRGEVKKNSFFYVRSRNVIENKRQGNYKLQQPQQLLENKTVARIPRKSTLSYSQTRRYHDFTSSRGMHTQVLRLKMGSNRQFTAPNCTYSAHHPVSKYEALLCASPTTNRRSPESP